MDHQNNRHPRIFVTSSPGLDGSPWLSSSSATTTTPLLPKRRRCFVAACPHRRGRFPRVSSRRCRRPWRDVSPSWPWSWAECISSFAPGARRTSKTLARTRVWSNAIIASHPWQPPTKPRSAPPVAWEVRCNCNRPRGLRWRPRRRRATTRRVFVAVPRLTRSRWRVTALGCSS